MTIIGNIENAATNSTKSLDDMIGTYKRRLDRTLRVTENKILDLTTRISLDTKGNVKGPKWTLAQTARIQGQLEGIFDENYGKLSRQFATDVSGVTKIVKKAHNAVDLPVSYSKVDMKMLKNLQEQTLVGLQAFSAQTQERISQSIQDAVVAGKPYRKLTNEIKNHITGLTDVAGRPLKQYAGVYAQDGLMNAYRTLSMEKAQAIKVKHFVWMGNVIAGTRPMCANSAGKAFTEQELQELDLSSWAGKSCSVFACCGGWNCRHMLMPISDSYFDELKGEPIEVPNWFVKNNKPVPVLDMKIISPKTYKKDMQSILTKAEIEKRKILMKPVPTVIPKPIPPVKPKVLGDIIPSSKATAEEIAKQYEKSAKATYFKVGKYKETAAGHKEAVVKRLAKKMNDLKLKEWDDFAAWAYEIEPGFLPSAELSEKATSVLIRQWACTSGDENPRSILMQLAAQKEFGLEGTSIWWKKEALDKATELFKAHEVAARRFLREMYNDTQEHLAKQGLKSVRVVRGYRGDVGIVPSTLAKKMEKVDIELQPMSSFSSDFKEAKSFAVVRPGSEIESSLIFVEVPANRILSCPITGYGCLDEFEWVVLGSQKKVAETMFGSMLPWNAKNWDHLFLGIREVSTEIAERAK